MPKKSPYPDVVIPDISFSDFLFRRVQQFGNDRAITDNATGESLTYSEVYSQSRRLAAGLYQRGLRKGDVVGICAPSCIQYLPIMLATASCGAVLTTCNPEYTVGEMLLQFRQAKPIMVFTHLRSLDNINIVSKKLKEIKHIIPFDNSLGFESLNQIIEGSNEEDFPSVTINPQEDVMLMLCSSGTTGLPKCAMHTHASCLAMAIIYCKHVHLFRTSVFYCERPMYNIGGFFAVILSPPCGSHLVVDTYGDIHRMLPAIEKYKVTHTFLIPPMLIDLLSKNGIISKYDLSSLLYVSCGGAPVSVEMMTKLATKSKAIIGQDYGMTECFISAPDPVVNNLESVGMIMCNTQVKIVDIFTGKELGEDENGEILVNGPQRMIGYFNNPEANAQVIDEEGWLRTGDIGRYNKEGMLFVTGRLKEVIKYKSFQVSPAEIEETLLNDPKIADVGVVGVPDEEAGQLPRALVVRKDQSLTEQDVKSRIERELTDYKHLRGGVQFVESIPRSIQGKILRHELKAVAMN